MIILSHLGESSVLKLLISCIKDKVEIQVWGCFLVNFPMCRKFPASVFLFLVLVFSVFSVVCSVSHILVTGQNEF